MIKYFPLILAFALASTHAFSQSTSKGFRSYDEYLNKAPSLNIPYSPIQRTEGNVFMTGGIQNYYFKKVKPKELKNRIDTELWGVESDGMIYINSYPYSKIKRYNKIEGFGFYTYFIGEPARTLDEQRELGIIGPNDPLIQVCCQTGYVMFNDGLVKQLNPELCKEMISDNQDLLEEFEKANLEMEDVYEMFDFLKRYNSSKE